MTGPRSVQPRSQDPETRATSAGFSASARVRAKAEFARTFADGRRIGHPLLALHLLRDAGEPPCGGARLGLAVSRKVDPRAVGRNRIKRVLRDAFRQQRMRLVPGSYVVVARTAARAADNDALRAAFVQLLQRADAFAAPGLDRHNAAPTLGAD